MRYFFDTEFIEYPNTIDLISIGIVAANGDEFYAEATDINWDKASPWVLENVKPQLWADSFLPGRASEDNLCLYAGPKSLIGEQIFHWITERTRWPGGHLGSTNAFKDKEIIKDNLPEFWGYYADYDWVAFCWLFGPMVDLPDGFPMYCRDLKQFCDEHHIYDLPAQDHGEHNALWDARWTRIAHAHAEKEKNYRDVVDAAHGAN